MLRLCYILLVLSLLPLSSMAQLWANPNFPYSAQVRTLYADTVDDLLLVGGNIPWPTGMPRKGVAWYNGTQWGDFGPSSLWPVFTIERFGSHMYFGGITEGNSSTSGLRRWNGASLDTVSGINGKVYELLNADDTALYVFGDFTLADSIPVNGMAKYDGQQWHPINAVNQFDIDAFPYSDAIFYHDTLYIAGQLRDTTLSPYKQNTYRLVGDSLLRVGNGLSGSLSFVTSYAIYQDTLYAAGYFTRADGNPENHIAKWDGHQWQAVGGGTNREIWNLQVYNSRLYAFGVFHQAGGIESQYIAIWDGRRWCSTGSDIVGSLKDGAVFRDTLFVAGPFGTINGDTIRYVAKWIGGSYTDTCQAPAFVPVRTPQAQTLHCYPNPAQQQLTVTLPQGTGPAILCVYNLAGQTVFRTRIKAADTTLQTARWPAGLYQLVCTRGRQRFVARVVVGPN